jgi:hypothetical protein
MMATRFSINLLRRSLGGLTLVLLVGCGDGSSSTAGSAIEWSQISNSYAPADGPQEVKRLTARLVHAADYELVFNEWSGSDGKLVPTKAPSLPAGRDAIFVASGIYPGSMSIESVRLDGSEMSLELDVEKPGKGCSTLLDIRHPFVVLAVEKSEASSVRVALDTKSKNC